ncbi:MAG: OmpA family protein [Lacibacter sp.]
MKRIQVMLMLTAFLTLSAGLSAQIDVLKKIKNKTNQRIERKVDKTIDQGLDSIENAMKPNPNETNKGNTSTPKGKTDKPKSDTAAPQEQQSLQSFTKYDFVPGDKVLYYEDFSQDAIGDFPALWTTDKSGEVNTVNIAPGNWFNLNNTDGNWWYTKDIDFPKNFILEFDIIPKKAAPRYALGILLYGEDKHTEMDKNNEPGKCGLEIAIAKTLWETKGYIKASPEKIRGSSNLNLVVAEQVNHVIIWVQNRRVRIYTKGAKVLDVPTNIYEGSKFSRLAFRLYRGASAGSYVTNIKITTASPDMRSKLLTEGKIVSYGVYFDVNKDVVKPESYGTLKGIADVLNENPTVKIKIVGHTDADGADASNLDLSKRRAAAVKNELVKTFGIDASRIDTDGKGEAQPVAPNDTPSNKALNRRVEFIKTN